MLSVEIKGLGIFRAPNRKQLESQILSAIKQKEVDQKPPKALTSSPGNYGKPGAKMPQAGQNSGPGSSMFPGLYNTPNPPAKSGQ